MDYSAFRKLKAFFSALKDSGFKRTLKEIPNFTKVDGGRTPVDKNYALQLLRSFPEFQGDEFKDDNNIIKYLSDHRNRERVLNRFTPKLRAELEKSLEREVIVTEVVGEQPSGQGAAEQQAIPAGTATGTSAGGLPFGIPSLSSSASYRPPGRIVYNVPHAPETETKLALANKSGAVVGEATITPTSTTIRGTAPETSTIHLANSSGIVKEAGEPSKLVTTNSSGKIIKGPGAETPPSKIFIARSDGTVLREHAIKPMSRFSAFRSKVGGKITNAARIGLETANPFLKRAGNGLINSLSSIANPSGMGGTGSRSIFGRFSRFGRGAGRSISSAGKTVKKSRGLLALIGVLGFMMLVGVIAATVPNATPGETASLSPASGASGLDYTLPLKDPSIQPVDIRNQIIAQFPNAQISNWQTIIDQAKAHGFNPAFVLALWIEESGAQGASSYTDPLGCGVTTPTTDINVSLNCLFNFDKQRNFTNNQFADFMIIYAGGTPGQSLAGNANFPKFPNVVKDWYSKLVPSGPGALTAISVADQIKADFNLDVSKLPDPYPQWAYDVLKASTAKFQDLIRAKPTTVVPVSNGSHTSGDTISIKTGYDQNFFKQIFVHELGHRIKGAAGTTSPQCNGQTLEQIEQSEGYLTYYAEHATPASVKEPACGDNDQTTRSDEDFAESVSYYVNNKMSELNYGSGCITYNSTTNPYDRTTQPRPAHRAYMRCLLGP